jgi:flagellar biosynthesis/type III secretory pathway M-ring protein FliF/YscJ
MEHPFEMPFDESLDDVKELEKAKSKLIMDFGLEKQTPERITIEVLQRMIKEKPDRMTRAIRQWWHPD